MVKRYERGEVDHIDWLDRLTIGQVEQLRQKARHFLDVLKAQRQTG